MNKHAAKYLDSWNTYRGPTPGFIEEVFLLDPLHETDSSALALLVNRGATQATSVRWNLNELPCLTIWKNTASQEDGYVTGIEPATGFPFNRLVERKYGRVPKLASGETRSFTLDFGIYLGEQAVGELIDEATNRQMQFKPQLISQPFQ